MTKTLTCVFLAASLTVLVACGNVITLEPSMETPAAGTVAPTSTTPLPRLTATAPLRPPANTPTPTVTPTPVIHVVEEGDSLYSIAFEYGVSPDALQTVNGIEDPQFLSIGQELIVPIGQETDETTPNLLLPTPAPLAFGLSGIGLYETPVGSLWCLGEVVNTTAVTLTNVQVAVTLFNEGGEPVAQADAFAAADLIAAGERSPFGVLFTDPPSNWSSPQVTIIRGEEAGGLGASFVPIVMDGVEGQAAGAQFRVSGVVRNASAGQPAGRVYVIATSYDAEGRVTGFRQGKADYEGALAPGGTAPYTLLFNFHGDAPTDFRIIALGRISAE